MFVKICGITRAEDAEAAVEAGARALGFVFWPASPRFVDPYRARAIRRMLPPFVATVGVFVNQPAEYVNSVAALVRLTAVQLHGDEDAAYLRQMAYPVVKALAMDEEDAADSVDVWPERVTLLLDARDPERRGGTGRTVDWSRAAEIAARHRTLLSGGLTPENVAEAISRVRPFGIDVSSGVEVRPGIKDARRVAALFQALREVERGSARS